MKNFLECDLEEIIFNASSQELEKRGISIYGKKLRQVYIGNYGIADIITFYKEYDEIKKSIIFDVNVIELKKDKIGIAAFLQAVRYVKGIQSYLEKREFKYDVRYNIILIGSEIDMSGGFIYLTDLIRSYEEDCLSYLEFYTYKYGIDGIKFECESGYKLLDEGF